MLRFVPYDQLADRPNVVVDGSPAPSTRLTLSHWPGSPTPPDLVDDLSAQIVFRALDRPGRLDGFDAVSSNHFDQDGLVSAFALIDPDAAQPRRAALVDLARAGDFATYESRDSIRLAFALAAFDDPERSPLDPAFFAGSYAEQCVHLYTELLPRVAELVDHPERVRALWEHEDAFLTESLAAIEAGTVTIEDDPAADLAIVRVPDTWGERHATRFATGRQDALHPAAINRWTDRTRVVVVRGPRLHVELRYETWVMYPSRRLRRRPDLRDLAAPLAAADPEAGWSADPPGTITPVLRNAADSRLTPDDLLAVVRRFLRDAPAAWDPYQPR